ncbi:O-antigen ligase family protein [Nostocaceae cyanobacterium CENA357]|uniref:O-antigen ligase family protein n=1 Tax=Atlanticothrix silvestris CENA357 TaxID=1725252 RepID=A0A8J7HGY2_9CYAN|nr:O-antigen ligase family protein [Atlanticothrix silvestris]MBH8552825.1 O-antigen ligase family protein [Atlanticothrix silvestris CENA357]
MNQNVFINTLRSRKNTSDQKLFSGILIRWQLLSHAEKVVCLGIILIPLWWFISWGMMLLFWVIGIGICELWNHKTIRLSKPSLEVIAILLFATYTVISRGTNSTEVTLRLLLDPLFDFGSAGLLLWYIQSHKIRVRLQVAAWAFFIVICLMVVWWAFFHFVLFEPYYTPPRTLYALFTDKGAYNPNQLGSVGSFLVPYYPNDKSFAGLARHTFFFPHPTVSSFAIGFAGLIFLDLKNRYVSSGLALICVFLILIAQTRNAWVALSIVLVVRWLVVSGRERGITFLLMLFAITIFVTFSIPQVTDYVTETYTNSVEATSNLRKESTEGRQLIYERTWQRFIAEPLLGHGVNGPSVTPGYEFARIGTESFILGTLLYKSGLLGTGVFLTFYISFLGQLYQTRHDRPICVFMMLLYLSLAATVTEFMGPELFIPLLCTTLQVPNTNQLKTHVKRKSINMTDII